uniref:R3H-associated N-terminal domain-containing protein n=1 Tax=Trypanosoma vivax (strain Y486) TaxID=1055687 RepID=G0TUG8_TRYVY|nr:conserved hypothetical protein [Trypanosoma vivax Y486]
MKGGAGESVTYSWGSYTHSSTRGNITTASFCHVFHRLPPPLQPTLALQVGPVNHCSGELCVLFYFLQLQLQLVLRVVVVSGGGKGQKTREVVASETQQGNMPTKSCEMACDQSNGHGWESLPSDCDTVPHHTSPMKQSRRRRHKKKRFHHYIEVTDSSAERVSPTMVFGQHTKEILTVHNGQHVYEEEMTFHPYELYKHGKRQIHTRFIGYSSSSDLVMTREAISETSDVDFALIRRSTQIDNVICLDPKAHRPSTAQELRKRLRLPANRYRKYPGIRAPKNRKERNRLLNDYFASEHASEIMAKYRQRQEEGKVTADLSPPIRPVFANLPPVFYDIIDLDEDSQTLALEKYGVRLYPLPASTTQDPDSAEARFQGLNNRLRGELLHALGSEFLYQQITDLESRFTAFIADGNSDELLVFKFRDGYGRLICHGVAAFYKLVSQSHQQGDDIKTTTVSWPKSKKRSSLTLPKGSLMSVLSGKHKNIPYMSPQQTPQTTPLFTFGCGGRAFKYIDLGNDSESTKGEGCGPVFAKLSRRSGSAATLSAVSKALGVYHPAAQCSGEANVCATTA